jgi:hypothetical protein
LPGNNLTFVQRLPFLFAPFLLCIQCAQLLVVGVVPGHIPGLLAVLPESG